MRTMLAVLAAVLVGPVTALADEAPVVSPLAVPVADEAAAVAAIERLGGKVVRDEAVPGQTVVEVTLLGAGLDDAALAGLAPDLRGLTGLRRLTLVGTRVTDAGLKPLAGLAGLTALKLNGRMTGAGLEHLAGLAPLREVEFRCCGSLTDAGLASLKRLPGLRRLTIVGANITDNGLKHLGELAALEELTLAHTRATGAGLDHLHGLKRLRCLWLGPQTSFRSELESLLRLRRALPDCAFDFR